MANYYIEPFDQKKHTHLLRLVKLSSDSLTELKASPLAQLGLGPQEILYDCLLGTPSPFVVRDKKSRRIRGAFGCADNITSVCPWFLSDGFEREPENLKQFMKDSLEYTRLFRHWCAPHKPMFNFCLDNPRITRWLSWLGFTLGEHVIINGVRMHYFSYERRSQLCAHQLQELSSG